MITKTKEEAKSQLYTTIAPAIYLVLLSVCSLVSVPLGPIPFTLQTLAITFIAYSATPKEASLAIWTYMILGAIGVPIFASMRGGIGVLIGPSGGFLWGYALSLPFITIAINKAKDTLPTKMRIPVLLLLGILMSFIAYSFGTLQYMVVGGVSLSVAISVSVAPFVLIDLVKIIVALSLSSLVAQHLKSNT